MGKQKSLKQQEKFLKKLIANKEQVKIFRTILGEDENLYGFILSMSATHLLLQLVSEFEFNGYAIIKKFEYQEIRCGKYEKTTKVILQEEGILARDFGIKHPIDLTDWASILNDLQALGFHVIINSVKKKSTQFYIGSIVHVNQKNVEIHNYDPTGKLDNEPTKIKFKQITSISFGDRYSTIFRKYLKTN